MTTIRTATPADRDAIRFTTPFGHYATSSALRTFDKAETVTYVADERGAVIGQVMLADQETLVDDGRRFKALSFLFVAPAHRGRGVARALMAHAEAEAADYDGIILLVDVTLPVMRLMYERRGYVAFQDMEIPYVTDRGVHGVSQNTVMCRHRPQAGASE